MFDCLIKLTSLAALSFSSAGNSGTDMLTEHPLLSEPSSVSFYNWMSNAVGNRGGGVTQESPVNRSQHNSLQTGGVGNVVVVFFFTFCFHWLLSLSIFPSVLL